MLVPTSSPILATRIHGGHFVGEVIFDYTGTNPAPSIRGYTVLNIWTLVEC